MGSGRIKAQSKTLDQDKKPACDKDKCKVVLKIAVFVTSHF